MHCGNRLKWTTVAALLALAACGGGGGGGGGGSDPVAVGLTSNFVADATPVCPTGDSLNLEKVSALGNLATIGLQVTDCDSSLGIFGVNFDISFDPSVAQCASSNPCAAGNVLTSPLASATPVCTCNNSTGELIGSFSKVSPGTNDIITPGGSRTIAQFTLRVIAPGLGRVDMLSPGGIGGTSLITLSGGVATPVAGLTYGGGAVVGQ